MSTRTQRFPVTCRLCEGRCGLLARIEDGQLVGFEADPHDPVSQGFLCAAPDASLAGLAHPQRLTRPMRRQADGSFAPATWDEAIRDISGALRDVRRRHGPSSLGLYLGEPVQRQSRVLARSLLTGVGLGTPNILSTLALDAGPRLQVTEWMLGQATPLLADVGRAHLVLLLGADPTWQDWGPLHGGMAHGAELEHSRRTKGTKVTTAGPRRFQAPADQHLSLPPGREGWLLLGLLSAIVRGGWHDHQYVRDYTVGFDRLVQALQPFPVDRCAANCGLDTAQLSGLALKLSRAAMGVVHPGHGAFAHDMPVVAAWAWLALHTVTANTLRPGGLYAHPGVVDLDPALQGVRSDHGARTRVGEHPLLLLQAPGTALADEALSPGPGQLRALVSVDGDPVQELPASQRTASALAGLDLFVQLTRWQGPASAHAHWLLPLTHPWEQDELQLLDNILLPVDQVALSPAVVVAPGEARTADDILRSLFKAVHPGVRGSAHSRVLTLGARLLAGARLETWETRLLDWLGGVEEGMLDEPPHRAHKGETNRAEWRVSRPDERIDLFPEQVASLLARVEDPRPDPELPLLLRTSARRGRDLDGLHRTSQEPVLYLHPDSGIADGAQVQLESRYGHVQGIARHDADLRPDTVDLPYGGPLDGMALLAAERVDPVTGTPQLDGLACRVLPA